jgi:hypothetical protein
MAIPTVGLSYAVLTGTAVNAVHDGFVYIDITVPDFEVVTALRIGAHPGFILD